MSGAWMTVVKELRQQFPQALVAHALMAYHHRVLEQFLLGTAGQLRPKMDRRRTQQLREPALGLAGGRVGHEQVSFARWLASGPAPRRLRAGALGLLGRTARPRLGGFARAGAVGRRGRRIDA